jgi:hypothetical protein
MTLPTELLPLFRLRPPSAGFGGQALQLSSGLPAEALAKAGGEGRIRTSVAPKDAGFTAQCH